jgi:hypothetical protein
MERPWTYYLLFVVAWLATLWGLWQIGDAWVTWPTIDSAAARDVAHGKLWLAGGLILGGLALGGLATLIGLVQEGFARVATAVAAWVPPAPPRAMRPEPRPAVQPQIKPEIRPEPRAEPKPPAKSEPKPETKPDARPAAGADAIEPRRDAPAEPREETAKREPRLEPMVRLSGDTAGPREPRLDPPRPGNAAPTRREPKLLRDS